MSGSILFVHGTGVRLPSFEGTFKTVIGVAAACGITRTFLPCAWGDPLGVEFRGLSLPDAPTVEQQARQAEELSQWSWLLDDPLYELGMMTINDPKAVQSLVNPDDEPEWETEWKKVSLYKPRQELRSLLARGGLTDFWEPAKNVVAKSPIAVAAFKASAHELPEVCRAFARALVAQLHVEATSKDLPGPNASLRSDIVTRLVLDWEQQVYGGGDILFKLVRRAGTRFIRGRRNALNEAAAFPLGDVLLYQTYGDKIRAYIREAIEDEHTPAPVTLVAHSLGGIACVDLLARNDLARVDRLVTLGSQSPFMHEIGALWSLKPGEKLRSGFPPWLNVFDRNDFLSFITKNIFPNAVDFEVVSGQPFPESHSAYFGNEAVWTKIGQFIDGSAE